MYLEHLKRISSLLAVVSIYGVVLITPFIFSPLTDELFEFNKMIFVYLSVSFGWGMHLLWMAANKKVTFSKTYFDIPILIFLAAHIFSTILSIEPYTSFWGYYSRFNGGLASILTYTAFYYLICNALKPHHILPLLTTILVGVFGATLYALPEHFGFSPSCLILQSEFSVNCWKQDVQHRVFGTFGQPNWLAAYIVFILPLSFVFPLITKNKIIQTFAVTTSFISFTTLLFTKSKSGFLGFLFGIICLGILLLFRVFKEKYSHQKNNHKTKVLNMPYGFHYLIAGLVTTVAISYFVGTPFDTPRWSSQSTQYHESAEPTQHINRLETGGTDSGEIRMIVWEGALRVWRRYPLFGSGVETFAYSYYKDRPLAHNTVSEWNFLYNKAHNEILNYAATMGSFGVISFLLLHAWFTVYVLKTLNKQKQTALSYGIKAALLSGIIGAFVAHVFGFSTVMTMVILYAFFAIAHLFNLLDEDNQYKEKRMPKSTSGKSYFHIALLNAFTSNISKNNISKYQWFAIVAISIITIIVITTFWNRWQADYSFSQGKKAHQNFELQTSITWLIRAIQLQPREAVFYDELAQVYAKLAFILAQDELQQKDLTTITQQYIQAALQASDTALMLNPVHMQFYKSRIRILLLLSQIPQLESAYRFELLESAHTLTKQAIQLSPTDPQLVLTLAEINLSFDNLKEAIALLEKTVEMKPNYESARMRLAELYAQQNMTTDAFNQYNYILNHIAPNNEVAQEALERLQDHIN